MEPVYRFYVLTYSKPDGKTHKTNGLFGVIAKDISQAIAVCQQKEPQATIWDVVHHGIVRGIAPNLPSELLCEEV